MTAAGEACAEVLLDLPARRAERRLTYRVPEALRPMIDVGTRVLVPLGPRQARGFVLGFQPCDQPGTRELREIQAIVDPRPAVRAALGFARLAPNAGLGRPRCDR